MAGRSWPGHVLLQNSNCSGRERRPAGEPCPAVGRRTGHGLFKVAPRSATRLRPGACCHRRRKNLMPVSVVIRVMRCADHHACRQAQGSRQCRRRPGRYRAGQHDVDARRRKTRLQRRFQHVPGDPCVLADHTVGRLPRCAHRSAPASTSRCIAQPQHEIRRDRSLADLAANTICSKISTCHCFVSILAQKLSANREFQYSRHTRNAMPSKRRSFRSLSRALSRVTGSTHRLPYLQCIGSRRDVVHAHNGRAPLGRRHTAGRGRSRATRSTGLRSLRSPRKHRLARHSSQ